MNVSTELLSGVLVALVGGGGLFTWLRGMGRNKVDLVTIAQDAAGKVIERFEKIVEQQDKRIEELEAQDERCRAELAEIKRRLP